MGKMAMRRRQRRLPVKDRVRRLLPVFLKRRREVTAVKKVEVFEAAHLKQLMESRRWDDAEYYLERFLLPIPCNERSLVTLKLFVDIRTIRVLAKIADGGQEGSEVAALFRKLPSSPFAARLKTFIAQMKSDKTRPNLLKIWHKVELEGVDMIMESINKCPELQGDVPVPPQMPWTWVAAQHRLRQGPSRCKKKAAGCTPSHVLACAFLGKRLPSTKGRRKANRVTNHHEQPRENEGSSLKKHDSTQF